MPAYPWTNRNIPLVPVCAPGIAVVEPSLPRQTRSDSLFAFAWRPPLALDGGALPEARASFISTEDWLAVPADHRNRHGAPQLTRTGNCASWPGGVGLRLQAEGRGACGLRRPDQSCSAG